MTGISRLIQWKESEMDLEPNQIPRFSAGNRSQVFSPGRLNVQILNLKKMHTFSSIGSVKDSVNWVLRGRMIHG